MEKQAICEYCVYTIVEGKRLARLAKNRRQGQFDEGKPWTTASKLWQKARSADQAMLVLFGDAADCSHLLYWSLLTDVHVQDGATRYAIDRLTRLRGKHTPQELVLRSSGRNIAKDFIRPYAICMTPPFVTVKHAV